MKKRLISFWLHSRRRFMAFRGFLANAFSRAPRRLAARDESRRSHAGVVVDLFASIMVRVDGISIEDMDTTMDMLRCDFPNVEHSWLASRFQAAYTARYSLSDTLRLAAAQRTEEERVALALEILTMLYRVGGDLTNPTLFDRITNGLNLPGYAAELEELIATPGKEAPEPIQSLCFSHERGSNVVTLAKEEGEISFRALNCVHVLLIINDSRKPFTVEGRVLHQGDMQLLAPGQNVELSEWSLSYATIRAFIQNRYSGVSYVGYLYREDDEVSITLHRPRNPLARVRFSLMVELEILSRDADIVMEDQQLQMDEVIRTTYYTPFTLMGLGPYRFADLHNIESPGRSYQLAPDARKLLVTNLPYINSASALMLTPGLASAAVFEVSYSCTDNTGTLRIIEGGESLTVNGTPVKGDTPLKDGDLISLSLIQSLRCRFSSGVLDEESALIYSLSVQGLTREFVRAGRVVDNIDFTLRRGEMACILGPSGSGKSTLLSMLAGHLSSSIGTIHYNGELMTPQATNLRRHVAYIPREDILDEAMTVGEHVYHASIARRPRLSDSDRKRRVLSILNYIGLGALANRSVGRAGERTISDGERTRLNLGLDLTGTAEVFLIDEPISGLSSGDAERVIETLENMAASRILICTLHRPAQVILNRFKKVMVLNANGQMAFWGSPAEMVNYFRKSAHEMGLHVSREAVIAGGADYVFEVLEAPYTRLGYEQRPAPTMWQTRFESYCYRRNSATPKRTANGDTEQPPAEPEEPAPEMRAIPRVPRRSLLEYWRLFLLWMNRTFLARVRSRMGLYAVLLEGPVLALLIAGTLRASSEPQYTFYKSLHINEYLFLSLVLAMFFGLTDSACEILRDRPLIRRESNYKLFIPGYLLAKVLVLTGIAAVQCALYLLVSNAILGIERMFWQHMGVMVLTAFVGISLSLMVSALVRSDRTALNVVPLLLVPQILLAGALVRFEEMNEFSPKVPTFLPEKIDKALSNLRHRVAYQDETTHNITSKPVPFIAEFCPLRYAFEMMFVTQAHGNLWEVESGRINERREYLKDNGSLEELRFIQRAALLLNSPAADAGEAGDILRRVRKAAIYHDERFLEELTVTLEEREPQETDQPVEFFFANRKLQVIKEGVKTARKDGRKNEHRGFFLAPRQARAFSGLDQETDLYSVSTIGRNAVYLLIMGLCPIFVAAMRLRSICRGG